MSKSNLNIKELESKFDALLESFTTEEIKEWNRFDKHKEILEKFFSGQFQPVEISEVKILSENKGKITCIFFPEVFDYHVNEAC